MACWYLNSSLSCDFPGHMKEVALISSAQDDKETGFSLLQCFVWLWKTLLSRYGLYLPPANSLFWWKAD